MDENLQQYKQILNKNQQASTSTEDNPVEWNRASLSLLFISRIKKSLSTRSLFSLFIGFARQFFLSFWTFCRLIGNQTSQLAHGYDRYDNIRNRQAGTQRSIRRVQLRRNVSKGKDTSLSRSWLSPSRRLSYLGSRLISIVQTQDDAFVLDYEK